jgi:hypothetical protein
MQLRDYELCPFLSTPASHTLHLPSQLLITVISAGSFQVILPAELIKYTSQLNLPY